MIRAAAGAAALLFLGGCSSMQGRPAQVVLSVPGPLPVGADFSSTTRPQTLLVAASAYANDDDVRVEIQVFIDAALVGRCRLFSNGALTHRTLVCPSIPLQLPPGRHRLELRAGNDETATHQEDVFEAVVLEQ